MTVYRELLFDDDNLAELDRHNITEADVITVMQEEPKFYRTNEGAPAPGS